MDCRWPSRHPDCLERLAGALLDALEDLRLGAPAHLITHEDADLIHLLPLAVQVEKGTEVEVSRGQCPPGALSTMKRGSSFTRGMFIRPLYWSNGIAGRGGNNARARVPWPPYLRSKARRLTL